ncbi:MAG: (2Fe-2S)-binding protein [Xanthomonadales bacterium]|nr:(2Fe-2S)-binding protein [Xanthomonadales bacterium]
MYVCICNSVTDSDIRAAVHNGVSNMRQLRQSTGCASQCGCCKETAVEILQQSLIEARQSKVLLPVMQLA